jgi:histidinol-phosphatase
VPSSYADDLRLARDLADVADTIALARFGAADLVVESKPDLTPVSDADRAVEVAIRERLETQRPADSVLGEEFGDDHRADDDRDDAGPHTTARAGRQWVIDPIDGTKNYVRGVPIWATLIALLDDGEAVVGVVSAPALRRRWWAARGAGSWATSLGSAPRPLAVSRVSRLADASLSLSLLEGWAQLGRRDAVDAVADVVWRTREYGDFWSYMLVAEGAVDLAAEAELSLWDMAAIAPVVVEAGGRFTGLDGVDGVHQGNCVVSNGVLHDSFLAALTR